MIQVRRAACRGHAEHGWLTSHHTFSFADYYDPEQQGFGDLRVINEDVIRGGGGFAAHPHRDMEIVTYVLAGALRHEDSMGNGSVIKAGDVQRMSAGTGVVHSEHNASRDAPVHLFQIWVHPDRRAYAPEYEQFTPPADGRRGRFQVLVSGHPTDTGLHWHQDARLLTADLARGESASLPIKADRMAYLHVIRGGLTTGGETLETGDGARLVDAGEIAFVADVDSAVLLFDLRRQHP